MPKTASRWTGFDDTDMDLFFMSAMSLGPTGGLDIGQAFYVASTIKDSDPDSWVPRTADVVRNQSSNRNCRETCVKARDQTGAPLPAFGNYFNERVAWPSSRLVSQRAR
jgi:hypothetical protein